jgi:integrase
VDDAAQEYSVCLSRIGPQKQKCKSGILNDVPNVRQKGTRLGNWLTREQAKELLAVPDRSTLKGKRDYVIIALLVGCALRRRELDPQHRRHPAS